MWELDAAGFGSFVDEIPAPLCIGRVVLADGTDVAGFLCEPLAAEGARDITAFGGWRASAPGLGVVVTEPRDGSTAASTRARRRTTPGAISVTLAGG